MISEEYLKSTCKLGTEDCCAYLTVGAGGFECAKISSLKLAIDLRLAKGTMNAIGDNCAGWEDEKS